MRAPNRVTGLVFRLGKVLLIHRIRYENEFWVFPGGAVEGGEDPDQAIHRVMQEGTGLSIISRLHVFDEFDEHAFTWFYYACELTPGEPHLRGPEAQEQSPTNQYLFEWVDPEQINSLNLYPLPERLFEFVRIGV